MVMCIFLTCVRPFCRYQGFVELKKSENTYELSQPAIAYSKLTIETQEQGVKFVNFEHIVLLFLVFLLLTLSR